MKEETTWHNLVFFGKPAEIAGQYLTKGAQIYVEGKIKNEQYEKDGITRYITKVVVKEFQMLGGRSEQSSQQHNERPASNSNQPDPSYDEEFDDDIPF